MTVRSGREFLAIPGPTTVPDAVLNAMHHPAVDIYSDELLGLTESCLADLRTIFRTTGSTYIYAANGHGAWEAALTNTLSRGDKILVLESGRFAIGWGEMGAGLGLEVEVLPGSHHAAVKPGTVTERLGQPDGADIKAVLVVQIDTASGVVNDIPAIRKAMDAAGSEALFMVDTIASLATMQFHMDDWRVDVAVSGSQKGLMTPPGLSFTAVGSKARKRHETAGLVTPYWDWTAREEDEHYKKYCGTPPEHLLFGLRKGMDMILAEGLEAAWRRHALLAEATRRAVDVWSRGGALAFNIARPEERADSITMVRMLNGHQPAPLLHYCKEQCGVVLGVTIGDQAGEGFRIAHMGHVNAPMILGTLSVIEMGLGALGIPHEAGGVQAAISYLASQVPADGMAGAGLIEGNTGNCCGGPDH
ncbi:MAG: pyridoxal-phosphate-dependent aminotransferase family protein [Hyphomicrobiaceae bacterium]